MDGRQSGPQPGHTQQPRIPHLLLLPEEIVIHILRNCRPTDLCAAARSCKRLASIADLDAIWKPIASEMYKPATQIAIRSPLPAARPPFISNKGHDYVDSDEHSLMGLEIRWTNSMNAAGPPCLSKSLENQTLTATGMTTPTMVMDNSSTPIPFSHTNVKEKCEALASGAAESGFTTKLPTLPLPNQGFKTFLASLSVNRCFRCGVDARDKAVIGAVGLAALKAFKRRYCKACQKLQLLTRIEAKEEYLMTEKQLAQLSFVTKPWYNKTCVLYLRSQVEDLAILKWGSGEALTAERERRRSTREAAQLEETTTSYSSVESSVALSTIPLTHDDDDLDMDDENDEEHVEENPEPFFFIGSTNSLRKLSGRNPEEESFRWGAPVGPEMYSSVELACVDDTCSQVPSASNYLEQIGGVAMAVEASSESSWFPRLFSNSVRRRRSEHERKETQYSEDQESLAIMPANGKARVFGERRPSLADSGIGDVGSPQSPSRIACLPYRRSSDESSYVFDEITDKSESPTQSPCVLPSRTFNERENSGFWL
ncbi:hypothetical protein HDU97_005855 [Phlyctochytrium planicorne]|nr:hypothetical protein HDU97_005855 [Phlyctochytrium planicorne]